MYWNKMVNDLINQKVSNYPIRYLPQDESLGEDHTREERPKFQRINLTNGQYLTQREAECVTLLLQGFTMKKIGELLELSPRTIEYYLKRVKERLDCRNKKELIRYVSTCQFTESI